MSVMVTWNGMFLTSSLVLGFSMLALLSSDLPPLLPALSDLAVKINEWKTCKAEMDPPDELCWPPFQLQAVIRQSAMLHRLQSLLRRSFLLKRDEAKAHGENLFGPGILLGGDTCREHLMTVNADVNLSHAFLIKNMTWLNTSPQDSKCSFRSESVVTKFRFLTNSVAPSS